jgi:peptidoglycan/xylan/chitin deacetylase (PgdA/CDA1 family)
VRVALTFDAEHPDRPECPPGVQDRVLDYLLAEGLRATVFVQGRWAQAYPRTARRVTEDGHLLGSHSHFHVRMSLLTDEGIQRDIAEADRAIGEATGNDSRPWFRLPWADGADDLRVRAALEGSGYGAAGWDVVAEDWEPSRPPETLVRDVLAGVDAFGDGAVILLHTWPASTLEALPGIVHGLRSDGRELVTVAELEDRDLSATVNPQLALINPR